MPSFKCVYLYLGKKKIYLKQTCCKIEEKVSISLNIFVVVVVVVVFCRLQCRI